MIQRLAKFMEKVTGFFLEDHYNNQVKTNHSFYNDLYDTSVMAIGISGMC